MAFAITATTALVQLLESAPEQFIEVAVRAGALPGVRSVRSYTAAEIEQLNRGVVRMLLEELNNQPPAFRSTFMDHAIPTFIREGETASSLVHWNACYVVLLGAALTAALAPEHRSEATRWFAAFAGGYIREVMEAALGASAASHG